MINIYLNTSTCPLCFFRKTSTYPSVAGRIKKRFLSTGECSFSTRLRPRWFVYLVRRFGLERLRNYFRSSGPLQNTWSVIGLEHPLLIIQNR